ncbi:MAG: cation acetate symporter [Planctomycetaceae bacterium]|nr:cation acetate symporter [Planctomycetaceae bacterium]
MNYEASPIAVVVFATFVAITLGLSFYLGRQSRTASGYFAAGGGVPWFINGIAFAGDYLSAASFLGICGMIASYGYDGFLYSIGYLAGWIVALLVVAEPLKRLGKYTFADALDKQFDSRGIKLVAAISTLVVSVFYLIPQMVGAGVLIQPLLGFPHAVGVILVGAVVILIVATAGMVSTTYVQFFKGGLLLIFSGILTVLILQRGFKADVRPESMEVQTVTVSKSGEKIFRSGESAEPTKGLRLVGHISGLPEGKTETGPLNPISYLATLRNSDIVLWKTEKSESEEGTTTTYTPYSVKGSDILRPGNSPTFSGIKQNEWRPKLNFLSLMLALFCGTASLPHILIRYYTVKDSAAARKSTVVGIAAIGAFYVLTLYMGLGAMTGGAIDLTNSNMAAPLLARRFGELLFAIISAIAFTTVLGTVSGLIVAASGAVVHDLLGGFLRLQMNDHLKVRIAKISSVLVGIVAVVLGILFEKMNVSFLVGWAFSVAASANLPALTMLLFWKGTTKQGIVASVTAGMLSSLGWILLSGDTYKSVYGLSPDLSPVPFSQPGIVTIPFSFLVLIAVSLMTKSSLMTKAAPSNPTN